MATKIPSEVVLDGYSLAEQHQIDHLDGKVFVDRLSPLSRKMLVARSEKLARR